MNHDLITRMEELQKELQEIENDLDVQFTSARRDFHFFAKNSEMFIEQRFWGKLVSEIVMPLGIFECACNWYTRN